MSLVLLHMQNTYDCHNEGFSQPIEPALVCSVTVAATALAAQFQLVPATVVVDSVLSPTLCHTVRGASQAPEAWVFCLSTGAPTEMLGQCVQPYPCTSLLSPGFGSTQAYAPAQHFRCRAPPGSARRRSSLCSLHIRVSPCTSNQFPLKSCLRVASNFEDSNASASSNDCCGGTGWSTVGALRGAGRAEATEPPPHF